MGIMVSYFVIRGGCISWCAAPLREILKKSVLLLQAGSFSLAKVVTRKWKVALVRFEGATPRYSKQQCELSVA